MCFGTLIYINLLGIYPGVQFLDYRVCTYTFSFVDIAKQFSKVVVLIVNIFPSWLMRLSTFSCAYDHVDIHFCEGPVQVSSIYCLAVSTKAEYAHILSSGNFAPVFLFSCLSFSYWFVGIIYIFHVCLPVLCLFTLLMVFFCLFVLINRSSWI